MNYRIFRQRVLEIVREYFVGSSPASRSQDVPAGGTTGQRLAKGSDTDYDTEWVDDCPPYLYVRSTSLGEGDLHLKNSTWERDKALIKSITVATASTDWELWLLQNDNGYSTDDATIPALQVAEGMTGDATLHVERAYEDEDASGEVHVYYADNSGSNTCDLTVVGYALS